MKEAVYKKRESRDDDGFWKNLIERFFYPMLSRTIPDLYADANTTAAPRFLDKELRKVMKAVKGRAHVADYLVEVPLKDGTDTWVLLHIEIQGSGGGDLAIRMYHYKSLIFVIYKREPVALAIVTDNRPKNEKRLYRHELYNTSSTYQYNQIVIPELNANELKKSENSFDLVLYAAQKSLESKGDERRKHTYLKELLQLLTERGWSHEDKHDLLLFIEQIIDLQDETLLKDILEYQEQLEQEEKIMYVSIAEQVGRKEGRKEGERSKALEMARKLLETGMPSDQVATITGLSTDEITRL